MYTRVFLKKDAKERTKTDCLILPYSVTLNASILFSTYLMLAVHSVSTLYLLFFNRPVFSIPGYVVHYNQQLLRWLVSFHDLAVITVDD